MVPGRLEFAVEVRRRILADAPDVVAVELPATLEDAVSRGRRSGCRRFGHLLQRHRVPARDPRRPKQAVYVPVEPPIRLSKRSARAQEIGAQIVFADPDSTERPHIPDTYPIPMRSTSIPLEQYVEAYRVYPQERTAEIERFAEGIAWKLQGADPLAHVLVVLSLNLLDPVLDAMERPQAEPERRRREELQLVNPHPDCLGEITLEYPFLQERYEKFRVDDAVDAGSWSTGRACRWRCSAKPSRPTS